MQKIKQSALLKTSSYINGQWHASDVTFTVSNPATNEVLAQVSDAGENDAKLAIQAAKKAFRAWADMAAHERAKLLRNWFNLMM